MPLCEDKYTGDPLETIVFTPDIIKTKLLNINENKSPGPENIHPFMIRCLADPLSKLLSILFNKSIKSISAHNSHLQERTKEHGR